MHGGLAVTVFALHALGYRSSNEPRRTLPVAMVRRWLQGRWALLFSHPDDFASDGFEADRWLMQVEQAIRSAHIAVLGLARPHEDGESWVAQVGGAPVALRWADLRRLSGPMRTPERRLVSAVLAATTRFVLVLDDSLVLRRSYAYVDRACVPSPIELAWMAHCLRKQTCPQGQSVSRKVDPCAEGLG